MAIRSLSEGKIKITIDVKFNSPLEATSGVQALNVAIDAWQKHYEKNGKNNIHVEYVFEEEF